MAQALGYVTKAETGGYEGTLATMSLKKRIRILPNRAKETDAQPDFRVYTEDRVEIGDGWNRVGKASGNPYVSLTFSAPEFGHLGDLMAYLGPSRRRLEKPLLLSMAACPRYHRRQHRGSARRSGPVRAAFFVPLLTTVVHPRFDPSERRVERSTLYLPFSANSR